MLPLPSEKGFEAAQLGMKLVSAFEMVLAKKDAHQGAGEHSIAQNFVSEVKCCTYIRIGCEREHRSMDHCKSKSLGYLLV